MEPVPCWQSHPKGMERSVVMPAGTIIKDCFKTNSEVNAKSKNHVLIILWQIEEQIKKHSTLKPTEREGEGIERGR